MDPHAAAALTPEALLADRRWIDALARRLVREPDVAEDLAQETWRRALERPPTRLESARGWLHSVMRSRAREMRRGDARRAARERAAARPESSPCAADLVVRADAQRFVLAAVLALDPASREVVLLRFFEDLPPREIARRVGAGEGAVRSRLHRALADLRARLDGEFGGDRAAWSVALLGPGDPPTVTTTSSTLAKGALAMSVKTKTAIVIVAVLQILLVLWFVADDVRPTTSTRPRAAESSAAPRAAQPRRPTSADESAPTSTEATATATNEPDSPAAKPTPVPAGPKRLPVTALRFGERIDAPGAAEGRTASLGGPPGRIVGGGGGIVAVGTKWRPVPEKGTATLRGRVLDAVGAALPGADVLRVEPIETASAGAVVSYAHLVRIGACGDDGSFTFVAQPARAYRLVANWRGAMDRPRGLLLGELVAVEPRENETVCGVELRLPVDPRAFGAIVGRVLDDEGAPARVDLAAGTAKSRSAADGRFRLAPLAAGDVEIAVDDPNYRRFRRAAAVSAGRDAEIEIRLAPADDGPHEIDGVVRDADGRPVAGADVSLRGRDVARRRTSAADGSFRFRRLAATPRDAPWFLFVGGDGVLPKTVGGVSAPQHGLVVEIERSVHLTLLVRDAADGAGLPVFNVTVSRRKTVDGAPKDVPVIVSSLRQDEGRWSAEVPRGAQTLFVEAPGYRDLHGEIDVPREDGDFEAAIEMRR